MDADGQTLPSGPLLSLVLLRLVIWCRLLPLGVVFTNPAAASSELTGLLRAESSSLSLIMMTNGLSADPCEGGKAALAPFELDPDGVGIGVRRGEGVGLGAGVWVGWGWLILCAGKDKSCRWGLGVGLGLGLGFSSSLSERMIGSDESELIKFGESPVP